MPIATETIVGRDAELREVQRVLSEPTPGAILLVEGEPGIGKTTVWRAGAEAAIADGYRVLACRPAEAEAELSFAALTDLLEGVDDSVVDALPEPQRRALRVALLQEELSRPAPDPRALGTALAGTLTSLLETSPVLVAIDDVQWLDRPSATAIAFALRRVEHESLRTLLARRTGIDTPDPARLVESLPQDQVRRLELEGLSIAALHHLISTRLGKIPTRPFLLRIQQVSGGNPFFALELARALADTGPRGGAERLPVPDNLLALVQRRVDALPTRAYDAALYASATAAPTRSVLLDALGSGGAAALERAEREGVLEERRDRIRFTHPLLASAVYASAPSERRRRLHRRLAKLVESFEERARHLALAADGPEETVAAALETAARNAYSRGAPSAAAELMELCCELTPLATGALDRRRLLLADYRLSSGDASGAETIAETLVETLPAGPLRARACEFLAELLHVTGGPRPATALCEQALAEAGDDPELRARIHTTLSFVSYDDLSRQTENARTACEILAGLESPDPGLHSQALLAYASSRWSLTGEVDLEAFAQAITLEKLAPTPHVADRVCAHLGALLKYSGDFDGARRWLDETHRQAVEEGDDGSLPYALSHVPQLELWTGSWDRAAEVALEHLELSDQMGQPSQRATALWSIGMIAAHRGDEEQARAAVSEVLAFAEANDDAWMTATAESLLGFLELSLGNPVAAARHCERNFELLDDVHSTEPRRTAPDFIEALVEIGDVERARTELEAFESSAQQFQRVPLLATAARSRALVLAAAGDSDGAVAACEAALGYHEQVRVPFERARSLLTLGKLRRRRREKRLAREALEEAVGIFEQLGAPLWARGAKDELARVGLRRAVGDELTETERRIAELAASGLTNREIAQAAFVSPKTVEANLARVYRKLDIRSRAELGARMSAQA